MKLPFRLLFAAVILAIAEIVPASAETLESLSGRTHYHGIAFPRSGTASLLLATHHGLFAIDQSGAAARISPIHDYMGFSPDPADPLTYFASGHPAGGGNSGFLKSSDGGSTWQQISEGVNGPVDFHQMDVSGADPRTIYGSFGELQISRDGGVTWSVAGASPPDLIAIAASGTKAEQIYAATKNGLFISTDAGASWRALAFEGEIVSAVETGGDKALYAFVLGRGLMRSSEENPAGFSDLSNSFGKAVPLHLAVNPADGKHLALTTQANDVLESRDGGVTWIAY